MQQSAVKILETAEQRTVQAKAEVEALLSAIKG
jgi:hypothetical protein